MKTRALLASSLPMILMAQVPVADLAQTPRPQVPEGYTWKVADLYPTEAAWRSELEAVKALAESSKALAKDWTASPKAMADLLERFDQIDRRGTWLHAYTARQADVDMANSKFQKMKGEVENFFVAFGAQQASWTPMC